MGSEGWGSKVSMKRNEIHLPAGSSSLATAGPRAGFGLGTTAINKVPALSGPSPKLIFGNACSSSSSMEESATETPNILYPLRAQSWEFLDPLFPCLEERTKTKSTIWVACSNPTSQSSANMSSNPSNISTTGFCGLLSVLLGSLSGFPVSSSKPCVKQDPILVSKMATLLLSIFLIVLKPLLKLLGQRTDSFFHLPQ